jgi:Zinc carboxypeptidase/Cytosolic carboxypeptidase N-terminal domain
MRLWNTAPWLLGWFPLFAIGMARADPDIIFNTNFEGGSLGKIEKLGEARFRCSVQGQYDERGRNRQANWYFFRMEGVKGHDITLTLTDMVGEYNGKPGACPMNADTIPVFSEDLQQWRHFATMDWDDQKKEATLKFQPQQDRIWIAHLPPYTHCRLLQLLEDLDRLPVARVEVIGKSVQGRDLHLVTVTNFERPDQGKRTVWLQARQHAWETGTSYVMEGALRFITSEDARARALRDQVVFKFTPMLDPDGCATGKVRFNANGYDVNRHWDEVDLRRKEYLQKMPEIWCVKKAILSQVASGHSLDLMLNLHNEESGEYLETQASDDHARSLMNRFFTALVSSTTFDPSQPLRVSDQPDHTANSLYRERKIPVMLMEQRIGTSKKLGRRLTVEDRLEFGRQLITIMGETVAATPAPAPRGVPRN